MGIPYPDINPIAFQLGPLAIRWYGIAYVVGILLGWYCCLWVIKCKRSSISQKDFSDFIPWLTVGIVAGGRIGHVLFYDPSYYWNHPLEIFMIWKPGMSFHGGALGVFLAIIIFCRQRKLKITELGDLASVGTPVGLFFGRIANFINAELYGRVTDVPWGMVFPSGGPFPRHPSQLYEAMLEGLLLFGVMIIAVFTLDPQKRKPGLLMGIFLIGYGITRGICELFREPEIDYGSLAHYLTYGQMLCIPFILVGLYLACRPYPDVKRKP